ncbi:hypothetical protein M426DRAFT_60487 [Hypoxylon sp. CI-4A]|nr:hypothetical protein M426DRAFT_60487 [Hypoxylon sp. CI-4A]
MRLGKTRSEEQGGAATLTDILPTDGTPWYRKSHLLHLNYIILSLVLYSSANGYDGSMLNGLQALDDWQSFMDYPTGTWLGFVNSVGGLAGLAAVFPVAWTVHRFGRKIGIWIGNLSLVAGAILQTVSQNQSQFVVARALIGFANQWLTVSCSLLITEVAYPSHRGIVTALYNCGWYVGGLIAAWTIYGTRNYATSWSWRLPSVLQLLIPALCLPGLILAPESPRYLVSLGKVDEAKKILAKFHTGGVEDDFLALELEEIVTTLKKEKENKESTSYADVFKTKGNRHRLWIVLSMGVFAQWCGNGVVSFYLTLVLNAAGVTDTTSQTLINGFLQLWNLIFAVGAAFSVDRLGRRMLFLSSCVIMLFSYIFVTAFSGSFAETGSKSLGIAVVPFLFIYYAGYALAFTPLFVAYPAEIWPYKLRSRGLSLVFLAGQSSSFLNVFVNPIALDAISWKYYFVFVAVLIAGTINIYFFFPETKGYSLEEIAIVFDGPDAEAPTASEALETVMQNKSSDYS